MNQDYARVLRGEDEDLRGLFAETARRVGTTEQNVEKDFWVCWTLDALFNGLPAGGPRLLFKGGTSLSKVFGVIRRFSEDIDITVFRDDLDEPATLDDLEKLSGKERRRRLDAIRDACVAFITRDLSKQLFGVAADFMEAAGRSRRSMEVVPDETDRDRQTLLVRYPSVLGDAADYIQPSVRIEAGAKSALDPNTAAVLQPYVDDNVPAFDLRVSGVTTIEARRTFWDKVVILHGLRRWFENKGELRQEGQRVSRHYYDIHCLLAHEAGAEAASDVDLCAECVRHARMFFNRPAFDLARAAPGTFSLSPVGEMLPRLEDDYERMSGMIFGPIPEFDEIVASVAGLEERLNTGR